jgi:hypothetical protein
MVGLRVGPASRGKPRIRAVAFRDPLTPARLAAGRKEKGRKWEAEGGARDLRGMLWTRPSRRLTGGGGHGHSDRMRGMRFPFRLRTVLVLLLVLAAGMVPGVDHRGAAAETAWRLAYAMPDGTLPVICGEDGADPGRHVDRCLDCLSLAGVASAMARGLPLRAGPIGRVLRPADRAAPDGRAVPSPSARAPPAFA